MADRNDEDILRAILEKGGDRAKKQAAALLAQQPNTPDTHVEVKEAKAKKRRKGLGAVIGKIGNSKYYKNAEGKVVDQDGNILEGRLAAALAKSTGEEKKAAVKQAIASPTNNADANAERKIGGELSRVVKATSNLTMTQGKMLTTIPNAFGQVEKVIANLILQHEKIVSEIIKQNDELRDKVIETLTGVKTPTKAGGARTKPSKAVGASKVSKFTQLKSALFKKTERDAKDAKQKKDLAKQSPFVAKLKSTATEMGLFAIAGAAAGALASASGIGGRTPAGAGGDGRTPTGPVTKYEGLGSISQKYESGGKGVHTVSSGRDDPGGVSYGAHQLATNTGTMASYLASSEGKNYAGQFAGLQPGTELFNQKYKQVAASDPQGFAASQKAFITRTHFDPVSKHAGDKGWSVADPRIQEVLYSMGVQHGGAKKIVDQAGSPQGKGVEEQVKMLFEARKTYVAGVDMPASTRNSLASRYANEQRDVLAMSTAGDPSAAVDAAPGAPGAGGGGNVREAQSGAATRKLPISPELKGVLQKAALAAGVDVVVTSGGQPAFPKGPRTGSTRHDLGNAADLDLYVGGRILSDANPADIELKKKFVAAATAAGASGVGAGEGYMGLTKIHVGFGDPAKWGGASWLGGISTGSGVASATSGNRLSTASQQNAAAEMRQNQGPVVYNNNYRNIIETVFQTGYSPRVMQQAFNPFNMLANAVTGRSLF